MRTAVLLLLLTGVLMGSITVAEAQVLTEKPKAVGGDPVGTWEAEKISLQGYVPSVLLAIVQSMSFEGAVSGRLVLGKDGSYQADYVVSAAIVAVVLGTTFNESIVDTTRSEGTYRVAGTDLILEQNTTPVVRDTIGFSVEEDSLRLIQKVPKDRLPALVAIFVPADDPLVVVLSMHKTEEKVDHPLTLEAFTPGQALVVRKPGETLQFSVTAADPDGDPVAYAWTVNGVDQPETGDSFLLTVTSSEGDDVVSVSVSSGGEPVVQTWTVEKVLKGDFDGNGEVGFFDFLQLAKAFGKTSSDPDYDSRFDLNGSSAVDFADFITFVKHFGLTAQ